MTALDQVLVDLKLSPVYVYIYTYIHRVHPIDRSLYISIYLSLSIYIYLSLGFTPMPAVPGTCGPQAQPGRARGARAQVLHRGPGAPSPPPV